MAHRVLVYCLINSNLAIRFLESLMSSRIWHLNLLFGYNESMITYTRHGD